MKINIQSRFRRVVPGIFIATLLVASMVLIAWGDSPMQNPGKAGSSKDTIPSKKHTDDKDFDKELRQLDEAKKQLEELKNKNWDKIQLDIEEAMKKIDFEKINLQAEEALKKIDMEKIGEEIEEALRKIDFSKMERDIKTAMNDESKINMEKIGQEFEKARLEVNEQLQKKEWKKEIEEVKKLNMEEIQKEMENAKKELNRVKDELKLEKTGLKETMKKAYAEIEKAKEELEAYQEMIYNMEKEGLLSTKEEYTIRYKEGELSINGKVQSAEVTNKYKKYFQKDKVTIKKRNGDLTIDMD